MSSGGFPTRWGLQEEGNSHGTVTDSFPRLFWDPCSPPCSVLPRNALLFCTFSQQNRPALVL